MFVWFPLLGSFLGTMQVCNMTTKIVCPCFGFCIWWQVVIWLLKFYGHIFGLFSCLMCTCEIANFYAQTSTCIIFIYYLPIVTCYNDFPVRYHSPNLLIMLEVLSFNMSFFINIYILLITNKTILVIAVLRCCLLFSRSAVIYFLPGYSASLLGHTAQNLFVAAKVFLRTLPNKWLDNILCKLYQFLL